MRFFSNSLLLVLSLVVLLLSQTPGLSANDSPAIVVGCCWCSWSIGGGAAAAVAAAAVAAGACCTALVLLLLVVL